MGGLIAMELARRQPRRVKRLLLIAPAGLISLRKRERFGIGCLRVARKLNLPAVSLVTYASTACSKKKATDFEPDVSCPEDWKEVSQQNLEKFNSNPKKYIESWLKSV